MKTRSSAEIAVDPKNLDNSYLNLSFEKSLEVEAEASGGGLTASIQKSIPLDNLGEDSETTVNFGAGPFIFNVPISEESPTMEIHILEASQSNNSSNAQISITIKNIELLNPDNLREAYKASYNSNWNNNYYTKDLERD